MADAQRIRSAVWHWALVMVRLVGIGCAGWAAMDLLDASSHGSHVTAGGRWPAFLLVVAAGALALAGVSLDVVRPRKVASHARVLRDLFVVIVAAVMAQVFLSTDFKPFLLAFTLGVGGGAFGALLWIDRLWGEVRNGRAMRVLELLGFQACLVLVAMEFVLRLISVVTPLPIFARDESGVADAMAMYLHPPGTIRLGFRMNSSGHYDKEFARGERTVVSIGDSFSVGVVPHAFHFTTVCERNLAGVEVHNLGRAGIGPGGYLWFLEREGLALRPDLILINLFAGNDVAESRRWNNARSLIRSVCDRRNVLIYQVPKRLWRLLVEGHVEKTSGSRRGGVPESREVHDAQELRKLFPWIDDPLLESPSSSVEAFLRIESDRAERIEFAQRDDTYRKLFDALTAILEVAGDIPIVVMLIPDQFQVDEELWRDVTSRAGEGFDREQPQRRILSWLSARGVPCLDLLPVLRGVPPMADGHRHLYHLRDTHFNARGNRVAGEALAGFLRERLRR